MSWLKKDYVRSERTNVAATMVAYAVKNGIKLPAAIKRMAKSQLPVTTLTTHKAFK